MAFARCLESRLFRAMPHRLPMADAAQEQQQGILQMSLRSDLDRTVPGSSVLSLPETAFKARDIHYADAKCLGSGLATSVARHYWSQP